MPKLLRQKSNIDYRVLLLHSSFWIIYFSYRYYDLSKHFGNYNAILFVGFPLILSATISYVHYFLILPLLDKKEAYLKYMVFLLLLLTVGILLRGHLEKEVYSFYDRTDYYETIHISRIMSITWDYLSFVLFTSMIKFTMDRFVLENERKTLLNEKLIAELNYLKAQINPHFLFNTLHNLNYLISKRPEIASEIIIKLSDMMRYMIYEANKELVPLSQEIEYSQNYIELEAVRFNHPINISWKIDGDIDHVKTIPLLLITLVENAVKHGLSDENPEEYIEINIKVNIDHVIMKTENMIVSHTKKNLDQSGFGLENMKQRLSLTYGNKATLMIKKTEKLFSASLKIENYD